MKNTLKDLLLTNPKVRIIVVWVRADVNDPIHIQIKVVKFRYLVLLHNFAEAWVALTQPAIKFGDTHCGVVSQSPSSSSQFIRTLSDFLTFFKEQPPGGPLITNS